MRSCIFFCNLAKNPTHLSRIKIRSVHLQKINAETTVVKNSSTPDKLKSQFFSFNPVNTENKDEQLNFPKVNSPVKIVQKFSQYENKNDSYTSTPKILSPITNGKKMQIKIKNPSNIGSEENSPTLPKSSVSSPKKTTLSPLLQPYKLPKNHLNIKLDKTYENAMLMTYSTPKYITEKSGSLSPKKMQFPVKMYSPKSHNLNEDFRSFNRTSIYLFFLNKSLYEEINYSKTLNLTNDTIISGNNLRELEEYNNFGSKLFIFYLKTKLSKEPFIYLH